MVVAACMLVAALPGEAAAALSSTSKSTKAAARTAAAKPAAQKAAKGAKHKAAKASGPKQATAKRGATAKTAVASGKKQASTSRAKRAQAAEASRRLTQNTASEPASAALPGELGTLKQVIGLVRQRKLTEASALVPSLSDPAAQKLVEWTVLRTGEGDSRFERYAAFIQANADWPSIALLRKRAEGRLWQERRDGATVRAFMAERATSAKGRFALARAKLSEDRAAAERDVRAAWRSETLSADVETAVLAAFPDVLTRADHLARMNRSVGAKDFGAAMRAARRLGDDYAAIVKACTQAASDGGGKLLDAVPAAVRGDLGFTLCRIQYQLRRDDVAKAAEIMLAAARETMALQDTDEWWRARRVLARKLIDKGEPQAAYQVVSQAASPANPYYRAEFHFMSGWIALRFLGDAKVALAHFARIDEGTANPIVLARGAYWRGRAHEAAGEMAAMRAEYESAARHSTAYYGQLARARLGLGEIELRSPPGFAHRGETEVVRAAELLYTIGERSLALTFVTDLAEQSQDAAELAAVAEVAQKNNDARATLLVGKTALARGMPLDIYAFPGIGIPRYTAIGPDLARSVVYSVARTESQFNQKDVSIANAVGLMQVTPEAGKDTAKRLGINYDWKRLVTDPVYNTQIGAGELAALLRDYRGSFIMSFAGYNAGRSRVTKWVGQFGDPRATAVDAVDWVERIPFAETRNYVQRVMENLHVYRVRFGDNAVVRLDSDPRAVADDRPSPAAEAGMAADLSAVR